MKKTAILLGVSGLMLALLVVAGVYAQGPTASSPPGLEGSIQASDDTINFQGRLFTSAGAPVPAGNYNMRFTVCSASDCSSTVWGPTEFTAAVDSQGLFNVLLTPFNANHFTGNRWLRIEVCTTANQNPCSSGWDTMTPYQPMTSVAISIGNIRKNMVDTSTANSAGYILTITNSGSGGALYGVSSSAAGLRGDGWYGLYGYSGNGGYGVYGTGTSGVWGVEGRSPDSYGVLGVCDGDSYGVYGYSAGATGVGVVGYNSANIGVYGESTSGIGVWGYNGGATGGVGVLGEGFTGVVGYSAYARGVFGQTDYTDYTLGQAVVGYASATGVPVHGVYGVAGTTTWSVPSSGPAGVAGCVDSSSGFGVWGRNSYTSAGGYGIYGLAFGSSTTTGITSAGVFGRNYNTGYAHGVIGVASGTSSWSYIINESDGVLGSVVRSSDTGVVGLNTSTSWPSTGVYGWGWYGVYGYSPGNVGYGVFSEGDFAATGSKSAIVPTKDFGWRHLYAMESPDVLFEDVGTAQLINGRAVVIIDPIFAQTVNLNKPYQVFLTPQGNCGLYVAEKTATSFTVRALDNKTCSIAFDYRIIAKRLGYEDIRMESAENPVLVQRRIATVTGDESLKQSQVAGVEAGAAVQTLPAQSSQALPARVAPAVVVPAEPKR